MSQPNKYYYFANYNNRLRLRKSLIFMPATALLGILALISVFFISADTASNSYATSVESQITAEIDGTHYVTLSAPDVTFSISPSSTPQLSKQNINVNVETNATGGADLYLAMSGNTNALHLNGDTTSTAPAIEATASPVAASDLAANTWGYSTDDQTYSAVPTANSDPALLASVDGESVGSSAGGVITASVPVYFAASVDTSIPAGSYANRMTYSAVTDGGIIAEASLAKITVEGSDVENMQPGVVNALTIRTDLKTNEYGTPRVYYKENSSAAPQECLPVTVTRDSDGYMTVSCDITPANATTTGELHIVPKGSADDVFCQNGTYTVGTSECESGAWQWGSFTIGNLTVATPVQYMQDFTVSMCNDLTVSGEQIQLTDRRDGKQYWVGKLPDGNCWMTQNLDFDLSTSKTLTPDDTNITSNWTPRISTTTSISGYSSDAGKSYSPGDVYYEDTSGEDSHYHVGNYYQWSAATAGYTGTSESTQSICPKGWTLPSQSQFQTLINSGLSGSNFMNSPYYLLRGGYLVSSSLSDAGSDGYYWSSTPFGSNYAHTLLFSSGGMYVGSYGRYGGRSVRCVAAQ